MKEKEKYFLALDLLKEVETTDGDKVNMITDDGVVGIMLVFDTYEHALDYCNGDESQVLSLTEEGRGETSNLP